PRERRRVVLGTSAAKRHLLHNLAAISLLRLSHLDALLPPLLWPIAWLVRIARTIPATTCSHKPQFFLYRKENQESRPVEDFSPTQSAPLPWLNCLSRWRSFLPLLPSPFPIS